MYPCLEYSPLHISLLLFITYLPHEYLADGELLELQHEFEWVSEGLDVPIDYVGVLVHLGLGMDLREELLVVVGVVMVTVDGQLYVDLKVEENWPYVFTSQ